MEGGGTGWICRGHVGQASGKGWRRLWGPGWQRNLLQNSQGAQASHAGVQRRKQSCEPAAGDGDLDEGTGEPPPPPPPSRHTPPQTHVLPGPPLVTLVLTYINPISHTAQTGWEHTQAHPDKEGPQRGLFCPSCLFPSA